MMDLHFVKFRMPFIAKSLVAVTPPIPLMVKLFTFAENSEAGSVMAAVLVNTNVALVLLASIKPLVRVGELPRNG